MGEDENTITFQFTQESRKGDHFEYALETMLSLEKATGKVSCPLPGLATLAQEELDRCIQARTGSDVTKIIQKLFEHRPTSLPSGTRVGPTSARSNTSASSTRCRGSWASWEVR